MGSPCEIRLCGTEETTSDAVFDSLQAELARLEKKYSRFLPDSLTSQINQSAGSGQAVVIDEETARLLDYADTCFQQSDGLFDITSGSLRLLWNYQDLAEKDALPTESEIAEALTRVGWQKVQRTAETVALPVAGMEIDFGGIVKEYAADCLAGIAEEAGVAHGLVELGGDIRLIGRPPVDTPWQVGIRHPFKPGEAAAQLALASGALASSGDYERYTVIRGKRYSHILNPLTGWPVAGYASVSVVAEHCVVAGSAASIAMLMGESGSQWLEKLSLPYLCIDAHGQLSGSLRIA